MIRLLQNGNLELTDATGKILLTRSVFDPLYDPTEQIMNAQAAAADLNFHAADNYNNVIASLQMSVEAGHEMTAPPKPLMKLVDDAGNVTWAPFNPPLKDLVAKPTNPAPSAGAIGQSGPDLQLQTFLMTRAMYRKLFPDAAV